MFKQDLVEKATTFGWTEIRKGVLEYSISEAGTGHSYKRIFGPFLSEDITQLTLQDPYLCSSTHKKNFDEFLKVVQVLSPKLTSFRLITKKPVKPTDLLHHEKIIADLESDFKNKKINFTITQDPSLHDRELILNDGIVFVLGRGLDFFHPEAHHSNIVQAGQWNVLENRPCRQTKFRCFENRTLLDKTTEFTGLKLTDHISDVAETLSGSSVAINMMTQLYYKLGLDQGKYENLQQLRNVNRWGAYDMFTGILFLYESDKDGKLDGVLKALENLKLLQVKRIIEEKIRETL